MKALNDGLSPQRRWQKANVLAGCCEVCGKRTTSRLCRTHRKASRVRTKAANAERRRRVAWAAQGVGL
jgi:hypothetical protein